MSTITKQAVQAVADLKAGYTLGHADVAILNELARIALASLEAEESGRNPVLAYADSYRDMAKQGVESIPVWSVITDLERNIAPLYSAPPAPVSVPDAMEMDDDFDSAFEHGKAVGWNACRAAILQGANGTLTNEGTITATQFKPVADLYGLTSPTGGETSFTFDAVEARDFIDGGWSCQEYVELERFQEAVSGNSPVIPDGWQLVPKKITLEMECALSRADSYEIGWRWALAAAPTHSGTNDGWVACSERMPGMGVDVLACTISPIGGFEEIETAQWHGGMKGEQPVFITSADAIEPTHWMPLPAAPLQEVK
ncbi:DUF551 domain-containing protein [Escherichia coli]|uniref:DUF551 domain-containing protein n=1 Tax=Escherichia coli TaxID=562 RepID=UPI002254B8D3|nr:DUF551 domain-containing protein [Escherichia coli]MCX3172914.1 DUF551 domain-containing protein [Escherichia coli]